LDMINSPTKWMLLGVITLSMFTSFAHAASIRLNGRASVETSLIRLGDLAQISNCDEATKTRLAELTIGPAPAAGREATIRLDTIRRELALRGIDQTALEFAGASEIIVENRPQRRTRLESNRRVNSQIVEHVEKAITAYLKSVSNQLGPVDVIVRESSYGNLPETLRRHHQLNVSGGQAPWTGLQSFSVSFQQLDGRTAFLNVEAVISQRPQVLALKHGLPRGQVIRNVDLIWMDSSDLTDGFDDPAEVVGTETTKSIRANAPIRPDDIRMLPLVRRNDIVAVTAQVGTVSVMRYCKSLDEGTLGQFVTLVPVNGQERITAKVSGYREAVIMIDQPISNASQPTQVRRPPPRALPAARQQRAPIAQEADGLQLIQHASKQSRVMPTPNKVPTPTMSPRGRVYANQAIQLQPVNPPAR